MRARVVIVVTLTSYIIFSETEKTQTMSVAFACAVCGKRASFACSRCGAAFYCGFPHQSAAWNEGGHSRACRPAAVAVTGGGGDDDAVGGLHLAVTKPTCMREGLFWGEWRNSPLADPAFDITQYPVIKTIGAGSYGVVKIRSRDGQPMAFKEMKEEADFISSSFLHELEVRNLDHPNVVGTCVAGYTKNEGGRNVFALGMDQAGDVLFDFIRAAGGQRDAQGLKGPFDPLEAQMTSLQLLRGLEYCHRRGYVHGDVNPKNVLMFGARGNFKRIVLTDFGLSLGFYEGPVPKKYAYAAWYKAPELITTKGNDRKISDRSDVFAAGCCLYEIAMGGNLPLFFVLDGSEKENLDKVMTVMGPPSRPVPWWNPSRTLRGKRPEIDDLEREIEPLHPGLTALLRKMLAVVPEDRCSVFEAMNDPYFSAETKRRLEELLPETDRSAAAWRPIVYEKDLTVSPQSILPVLTSREQFERAAQLTAWTTKSSWKSTTGARLRCATAFLIRHVLRGYGTVRTACAAHAILCRQFFSARADAYAPPGDSGATTAAACHLLARAYRENTDGERYDAAAKLCPADTVSAAEMRAKTKRVLIDVDFNVMVVSTYDLLAQYCRINGVTDVTRDAAALLCLLDAASFFPGEPYDLNRLALESLAAVTGKKVVATGDRDFVARREGGWSAARLRISELHIYRELAASAEAATVDPGFANVLDVAFSVMM